MRFRPLGIGDIIDGAFKLFRADWREILLAVGIVVVPAQVILAIIQVGVLGNLAGLEEATFDADLAVSFAASVSGLVGVSVLTGLLLIIARVVVLRISGARLFGAEEAVPVALRAGVRLFGRLLANSILKSLVLVAVFLPAAGLGALAAVLDGQGAVIALAVLAFLAGLGALAWLYVSWALTETVIVLEGVGIVAAFGRSRRLVAGRWWPTLGVLVLTGIVVSVIGGIIGGVPQQIGGALLLTQAFVAAVLIAVGGILSSLVTEPLTTLVSLMLWTDLRVRKEGLDMQVAERLEAGASPPGAGGWGPGDPSAPDGGGMPGAGGMSAPGGADGMSDQGWPGHQGWGRPG